jgi:pantothenate kinase
MSPRTCTLADLEARVRRLADGRLRVIVGLVGAPGAGKSTVAQAWAARLGAVVVPMDGFHLAQEVLANLGRADRKGAPDTFDAAGYVALLRRLRDPGEDVVYAPRFRRDLEEPIAGSIPVPAAVSVVLTEGNYLLLDHGPWAPVRGLLDECWYLQPDDQLRRERLVARHIAFGRSPAAARAWALGTDERNAELIAASAHRADLVFDTA